MGMEQRGILLSQILLRSLGKGKSRKSASAAREWMLISLTLEFGTLLSHLGLPSLCGGRIGGGLNNA